MCPGVDLGGIPLSRAPQIFRRNTRFAGTVIRPDYQLLPRFGDPILVRASIIRLTCPHVFKQIEIYNYFVRSQSSPTKLRRTTVGGLISMQRRGTRATVTGDCWLCILRVASWLVLFALNWRCDSRLPKLIIAIKAAVNFPTELTLAGHHVWKTQPSQITFWCLALGVQNV